MMCFVVALVACGGADERKEAYLKKAQESYKSANYDKARIEIKNAIQIDPKYAEAHFLLGKVHEEMRDYRKAFGRYSKATELSPENLLYQAKLGRYYLVLAQDLGKAREKMELILKAEPNNVDGMLLKAGLYVKEDKKSEALELAEEVTQPGEA